MVVMLWTKSYQDSSSLRWQIPTNHIGSTMDSKWCEMDFVHPQQIKPIANHCKLTWADLAPQNENLDDTKT